MASIEISPEINKVVKDMAEKRGCTGDEAAEYLITKGVQKWNAEHKYLKSHPRVAAEKPKAKAKKKAAKAKGPIARKGGGKVKEAPAAATVQ
jgi:hypothetical protein